MTTKALTDRAIKALKSRPEAYVVPDGIVPKFGVRVMPSGHKTFVLVTRFPGSRHPVPRALGAYGAFSLEQARRKAREWLELLAQGRDPTREEERQREESARRQANTFESVLEDYIRLEAVGVDPAKPKQRKGREVARDLRRTFLPLWNSRSITELTRSDVLTVIEAVRDCGTDGMLTNHGVQVPKGRRKGPAPVQARNLFGYLQTMFAWAIERQAYGLTSSPCDHIRKSRVMGDKRSGDRILTDDEIFAFGRTTKRLHYPYGPAYRLLLLSGLRLNEVADAVWSEFDIPGKLWVVPAVRMKGKNAKARPHVIPLTADMVALLETLPRLPRGEHLFSTTLGTKSAWLGSKIKTELDRRMLRTLRALARKRGSDASKVKLERWINHDLRRTLRSRLSMLRVQPEVAEALLAHTKPGIKGVYDRYDLLDERRTALELWAAHLKGVFSPHPVNNVVKLPTRV